MKIKLGKEGKYLKPAYEEDLEKIKNWPEGSMIVVSVTRIRNPAIHRKYFALLNIVFENQEFFDNFEHFRKFIEMCAGHYEVAYVPHRKTGEILEQYWPQSIAYEKLDQDSFEALYDRVMRQCEINFGIDPETYDGEAENSY